MQSAASCSNACMLAGVLAGIWISAGCVGEPPPAAPNAVRSNGPNEPTAPNAISVAQNDILPLTQDSQLLRKQRTQRTPRPLTVCLEFWRALLARDFDGALQRGAVPLFAFDQGVDPAPVLGSKSPKRKGPKPHARTARRRGKLLGRWS